MKKIVSVLIACFVSVAGYTQVSVSAKLDTNAMLIGDHVGITLKYTGPVKTQVMWPFLPDTILGSITVIGRGKVDTAFSADKKSMTLTQQLNFTCYDSGFYNIPPITFSYRNLPDTSLKTADGPVLLLAVHTMKVDTTQAIKGIKGPLSIPISFREMVPWILTGLALAAVIAIIIWYIRKRKKREPVFQLKPKVQLLPHEIALQEMEKLRVKKLWQQGKVKEFHSDLTEIIRVYIENYFQVPALEQTSAEIEESLINHIKCPKEALNKLDALLIRADMVKFAKGSPLPAENEKSLTEAIDFVYETTNSVRNEDLGMKN